jgi:hypothetical protein
MRCQTTIGNFALSTRVRTSQPDAGSGRELNVWGGALHQLGLRAQDVEVWPLTPLDIEQYTQALQDFAELVNPQNVARTKKMIRCWRLPCLDEPVYSVR